MASAEESEPVPSWRGNNILVVLILLGIIGLQPVLVQTNARASTTMIVVVVAVLSGVLANLEQRRLRNISLVLAVIPSVTVLISAFGDGSASTATTHTFLIGMVLFLAFTVVTMTTHFMRCRDANAEMLAAALSVYLLMGLLWACLYAEVLLLGDGQGLSGLAASDDSVLPNFPDLMYFSYITLTTLGYGDVTPTAAILRSLATVEAIVGQVFLVVLVARLVGLHVAQQTPERPSS